MGGIKEIVKQRITIDQLNELSSKNRERLAKWVERNHDNKIRRENPDFFIVHWRDLKTNPIYLLSIGQMIEFLNKHCKSGKTWKTLEITQYADTGDFSVNIDETYADSYEELCDALWEAVKKVLEQQP